jgi:hypothetical protein
MLKILNYKNAYLLETSESSFNETNLLKQQSKSIKKKAQMTLMFSYLGQRLLPKIQGTNGTV